MCSAFCLIFKFMRFYLKIDYEKRKLHHIKLIKNNLKNELKKMHKKCIKNDEQKTHI